MFRCVGTTVHDNPSHGCRKLQMEGEAIDEWPAPPKSASPPCGDTSQIHNTVGLAKTQSNLWSGRSGKAVQHTDASEEERWEPLSSGSRKDAWTTCRGLEGPLRTTTRRHNAFPPSGPIKVSIAVSISASSFWSGLGEGVTNHQSSIPAPDEYSSVALWTASSNTKMWTTTTNTLVVAGIDCGCRLIIYIANSKGADEGMLLGTVATATSRPKAKLSYPPMPPEAIELRIELNTYLLRT
jgi:hypothetical protein